MAVPKVSQLSPCCLKTKREAIEGCAKVVDNRVTLWKSHGGAEMASPHGHLTVEGECEVIAQAIRALLPKEEKC